MCDAKDRSQSPPQLKTLEANLIADYNDKMADLYDWVANESLAHRYNMGYTIKKACGDVQGKKCLEAACGNGAYMKYLWEKGASFIAGVELSAEQIAVCRKNHKAAGIPPSQVSCIQADISVPQLFEGHPFDLVVMGCCICYSSSMEELLGWIGNAFENLKPGGRLVIVNTRGALPAAEQEELKNNFGFEYLKEVEGGSKSFSPAFARFPNGWQTDYFFLEASTIEEAMLKVGFKVERPPMEGDPDYKGDQDLARLVQLMPYDLFVGTK